MAFKKMFETLLNGMTINNSENDTGDLTPTRGRWALSFLLLLLVVYACGRLGWWQWQRAAEFKAAERPIADAPRVDLAAVTEPLINLPETAEGRLVSTSGRYVRTWIVPDRQVGDRTGPWMLALLDRGNGSGVLVVRGWAEADAGSSPDEVISVDGRLLPSQNPEVSAPVDSDNELGRIDPALVIAATDLDLFDGYIIASSEQPTSGAIERVPAPPVTKSPPGYYLQHVAYVVLWWFFGLVAVLVWGRAFFAVRRQSGDSLTT